MLTGPVGIHLPVVAFFQDLRSTRALLSKYHAQLAIKLQEIRDNPELTFEQKVGEITDFNYDFRLPTPVPIFEEGRFKGLSYAYEGRPIDLDLAVYPFYPYVKAIIDSPGVSIDSLVDQDDLM